MVHLMVHVYKREYRIHIKKSARMAYVLPDSLAH